MNWKCKSLHKRFAIRRRPLVLRYMNRVWYLVVQIKLYLNKYRSLLGYFPMAIDVGTGNQLVDSNQIFTLEVSPVFECWIWTRTRSIGWIYSNNRCRFLQEMSL